MLNLVDFHCIFTRKLQILKYWLKVRQSNFLSCYDYMMRIMLAERSTLNKEFKSLGLGQMWDELILDVKSAYKIIEEIIYYTEKKYVCKAIKLEQMYINI